MIEQLASQILNDAKKIFAGEGAANQANSLMRAAIEARLRAMNLVTREEFDTQQLVLARTREKIEALERSLAELESQLGK